ncbi:MAG: hypothetical protein R3F48_12120 [Candidatus Zixiibacteriota bacterium]
MEPKSTKHLKRVSVRNGFKDYTYLGCPLTRNRSPWCFRMCRPNAQGLGYCGRVAPHAIKSRIQAGIEEYRKRKLGASVDK